MHCSACSTAVERALKETLGVHKAAVSLSLSMAEVTYNLQFTNEVMMGASALLVVFTCFAATCCQTRRPMQGAASADEDTQQKGGTLQGRLWKQRTGNGR